MSTRPEIPNDEGPWSPREFCKLEKISRTTYYKMQKSGFGPEEELLPGIRIVRITAASRARWHARLEQLRNEQSTVLERQRRVELAKRAASAAVASPLHHSKRKAASRSKAQESNR
jgi:hypothetical protein